MLVRGRSIAEIRALAVAACATALDRTFLVVAKSKAVSIGFVDRFLPHVKGIDTRAMLRRRTFGGIRFLRWVQ